MDLTPLDTTKPLNRSQVVGEDQMKIPRGILAYNLAGRKASSIAWKLTGNLGGEDYLDKVRGPLNEGGLYAERQGWHLPGAPISDWQSSTGFSVNSAGVNFYAAELKLDLPRGWDVPLSFMFHNTTKSGGNDSVPAYRAELFVNGWQFGKYVNNIGPQISYPVHEGILNYRGTNYISLALWSLEVGGATVEGLELYVNGTILSGFGDVPLSPMNNYKKREGAY